MAMSFSFARISGTQQWPHPDRAAPRSVAQLRSPRAPLGAPRTAARSTGDDAAATGNSASHSSNDVPAFAADPAPAAAASSAAGTPTSAPPHAAAHAATASSSSGGGGDPRRPSARATAQIERLQVQLLAALSSLDRGLAANAREAAEVDELCSQIEGLGGAVRLVPLPGGAPVPAPGAEGAAPDLLSGMWRLVYSSGFNSGSLGGRRPGPPAALFPTVLGQVYQRIEPGTATLDNIVELLLSTGPPDLGLGLAGALKQGLAGLGVSAEQLPQPLQGILGAGTEARSEGGAPADSPAARLTLRHDYEITGACTVRIVYEETYGELVGSSLFSQLPRLAAPSLPDFLKPPKFLRSATFEVTFLDASLRITRGDRGELRVYLRDSEAGAAVVGGSWGAGAATALDYED